MESELAFGEMLFEDEIVVGDFVASQPSLALAHASAVVQVLGGLFCAYALFPIARWTLSAWPDALTLGVGDSGGLARPVSVLVILVAIFIVVLSGLSAVQTISQAYARRNQTRFVLTNLRLLGIGATEPNGPIIVALDRLESVVVDSGVVVFRGLGGTTFKFEKIELAGDVPAAFSAAPRARKQRSRPDRRASGAAEPPGRGSDGRKWKGRSADDHG